MFNKLKKLRVTIYTKSGNTIILYAETANFKFNQEQNIFTSYSFDFVTKHESVVLLVQQIECVVMNKIWVWQK